LIASHVDAPFIALGTDGFGRSDSRTALRSFFEVDRRHIAVAALHALGERRAVPRTAVAKALVQYAIDVNAAPPWTR